MIVYVILKLLFQQLQILINSCPRQLSYTGKIYGVHEDPTTRNLVLKDQFKNHCILVLSGTNEETRSNYAEAGDEVRVLQYKSARCLEA